jgi:2'-5' RNA ligase
LTGHTLGVAIVIASPAREIIEEARARYEPISGEMPPHVTVLAPIDVDRDAMPAVVSHLESVAAATRPFQLSLRGTGTFRPVSPVAFIVISVGVDECGELESRVRAGDMAVETRFPYHPHVTVAHDVAEAVLDNAIDEFAAFEADMQVRSIGLYERVDGRWELVREFAFTG